MATFYPFRGYRYDASRVGPLEAVVTQPYDKIPNDLRGDYLGRSPWNIVRVIRNEDYSEAAGFLEEWIRSGVFQRDAEPSYYIYEQEFEFESQRLSRIGLIGLVALDGPGLVVKGHEKVLEGPLADRLELIRHTRANEGLVFTLLSDPELTLDRMLQSETARNRPSIEVKDDFGVINRIWVVSNPATVAAITQAVGDGPLYIADGHHRFQTSVTYFEECKSRGWRPAGPESFHRRMVALFNMDSEGVRILPTHRGIRTLGPFDSGAFAAALARRFKVRKPPDQAGFFAAVEQGSRVIGFAWVSENGLQTVLAELEEEALEDPNFMMDIEGPLRSLDVSILHAGVLEPMLGIAPRQVAGGEHVHYFRDKQQLLEEVSQGHLQLGCFLRPTSLAQVREVSEFGARMPQKSTDFYPKLLTGLVLMKMEIA